MSARLAELVAQLEPDAVRVLELQAERLVMGRKQYGDLDIDKDKRDFVTEALNELLDGTTYLTVEVEKLRRRLREVQR